MQKLFNTSAPINAFDFVVVVMCSALFTGVCYFFTMQEQLLVLGIVSLVAPVAFELLISRLHNTPVPKGVRQWIAVAISFLFTPSLLAVNLYALQALPPEDKPTPAVYFASIAVGVLAFIALEIVPVRVRLWLELELKPIPVSKLYKIAFSSPVSYGLMALMLCGMVNTPRVSHTW